MYVSSVTLSPNGWRAGGHVFDWGFTPRGQAPVVLQPITFRAHPPVSQAVPDEKEHRRLLAAAVNRTLGGKLNVSTNLTLTASAASTVLTDQRISPQSFVHFMPRTANAAAEMGNGTLYVDPSTMATGSCTVNHANNSQTDRSYIVLIIG